MDIFYCNYDQEIELTDGAVAKTNGQPLNCLDSIGGAAVVRQTGTGDARYNDDYAFQAVWSALFGGGGWVADIINGLQGQQGSQEGEEGNGFTQEDIDGLVEGKNQRVALNDQCEMVAVPDNAVSCGDVEIGFIVSPIGLDFGGEDSWTTVRFKLSPRQRNPWVVWKASGSRPLLVYDPEHTGKVVDGRQLFGNWSFGGRKAVRLASRGSAPIALDEWDNGYQALAELDRNKDGFIRDRELQPLALWFDRNQNAVAEPGEVVPAVSEGITSLRTTYDTVDPKSGTLLSVNGYERQRAHGKAVQGSTFDWYSDTYTSRRAAIAELDRAPQGHLKATIDETLSPTPRDPSASKGQQEKLKPLDGFWRWRHDSDPTMGGVFFLEERNGRVAGVSVVERPQKPNQRGVRSFLDRAVLIGTISGTGSTRTIRMTTKYNGVVTTTTATLDEKSGKLTGTSSATKGGPSLKMGWNAKQIVAGNTRMLKK